MKLNRNQFASLLRSIGEIMQHTMFNVSDLIGPKRDGQFDEDLLTEINENVPFREDELTREEFDALIEFDLIDIIKENQC